MFSSGLGITVSMSPSLWPQLSFLVGELDETVSHGSFHPNTVSHLCV